MIINSIDPRGYNITCDSQTWNNHIIEGHTIMQGNENTVKKTIESPDVIYRSSKSPIRDVYFSRVATSSFPSLYTKVVVEVDSDAQTGEVVSAWPQLTISGGIEPGGVLYVKNKL